MRNELVPRNNYVTASAVNDFMIGNDYADETLRNKVQEVLVKRSFFSPMRAENLQIARGETEDFGKKIPRHVRYHVVISLEFQRGNRNSKFTRKCASS